MAGTWKIRSLELENGHYPETNLLDLGVTDFKIKFCNRAADEATIRFERRTPIKQEDDIWDKFELGRTYRISCASRETNNVDTPIFCGRLEKAVSPGDGSSQSTELRFLGGWHFLELMMCLDEHQSSDTPRYEVEKTTRFAVGEEDADTDIKRILDSFAQRAVPGVHTNGDATFDVDVSSVDSVPKQEFVDYTCAEVLDKVLGYFPDAFVWTTFNEFETDEGPLGMFDENMPFFHIKRRGEVAAFMPDDVAPDIFSCVDLTSYDVTSPIVERIPGVRVFIEGSPDVNPSPWIIKHDIGNPLDLGGLIATIASTHGLEGGSFARNLWWNNHLGYQDGRIVLGGRNPPNLFSLRPDRNAAIGIFNEHYAVPIQSVEFDIGLGRTTIEFGSAVRLGTQDLVSLAVANPTRGITHNYF